MALELLKNISVFSFMYFHSLLNINSTWPPLIQHKTMFHHRSQSSDIKAKLWLKITAHPELTSSNKHIFTEFYQRFKVGEFKRTQLTKKITLKNYFFKIFGFLITNISSFFNDHFLIFSFQKKPLEWHFLKKYIANFKVFKLSIFLSI